MKRINFLRPAQHQTWAWPCLIAGSVVMALAWWFSQHWALERAAALQAAQAAAQAQRAARQSAPRAAPTAAQQGLQRAHTELRRPWLSALSAIESAALDPVYLLALNIEPATGAIKIEAEAPSFGHAVAFTQALADNTALAWATLASHETALNPSTQASTVRFTVRSQWGAP
jgi:hypothetical protein